MYFGIKFDKIKSSQRIAAPGRMNERREEGSNEGGIAGAWQVETSNQSHTIVVLDQQVIDCAD